MCELLGMSCQRPVQLTFSLAVLASHAALPSIQRDGWGAAFYQDGDVALFREPAAACDSPLVRFLEHQGPSTKLAISHIRHATCGDVSLRNTQPFLREFGGRVHTFAHNGDLPGIKRSSNLAYDRFCPVGMTDSEHAFCALMERISGCRGDSSTGPSSKELATILAGFAADLRKLGPANFLYADGNTLFAYGDRRIQPTTGELSAPGLYLYTCRCVDENTAIETSGLSISPGFQEVAVIASVPLSDQRGNWRPLAEGELLAVSDGRLLD